MAESEMLVMTEIALARAIITRARASPALPTTYPSLRNRIIPRMVRMLGVKTPANVLKSPFETWESELFCMSLLIIFYKSSAIFFDLSAVILWKAGRINRIYMIFSAISVCSVVKKGLFDELMPAFFLMARILSRTGG